LLRLSHRLRDRLSLNGRLRDRLRLRHRLRDRLSLNGRLRDRLRLSGSLRLRRVILSGTHNIGANMEPGVRRRLRIAYNRRRRHGIARVIGSDAVPLKRLIILA